MLVITDEELMACNTLEDFMDLQASRIREHCLRIHREFRLPRAQSDLCAKLYNLRVAQHQPHISPEHGVAFNVYSATCCLMVVRGYAFEKALDITIAEDRARVPEHVKLSTRELFETAKKLYAEHLQQEAGSNPKH